MSTLISTAGMLSITDKTGDIFAALAQACDQAGQTAASIKTALATTFASDTDQQLEWYPGAKALTTASVLIGANGLPMSATLPSLAVVNGGFGKGQGIINRAALLSAALYPWLDRTVRPELALYAPSGSAVVDIDSYATYQNGLSALSCLYSPNFAAAYWYAYGQSAQLSPGNVFAPSGILLATGTITAANTVTLAAGALPSANGYTSPTPGTDEYGNPVYVGGLPMAQGFAAVVGATAKVTTAINGTCAATFHAPDQNGTSQTWTATLDNLNVNGTATFTCGVSGARIAGVPSAMTVAGIATSGVFQVLTALERSS